MAEGELIKPETFSFLKKHFGPFSMWEWAAIGSGGVLVVGFLRKGAKKPVAASTQAVQPVGTVNGGGLGFDANTASLVSLFDNQSALLQQIITNQNKAPQPPVTPVTNPGDPAPGTSWDPSQTWGSLWLALMHRQAYPAGSNGAWLNTAASVRSGPTMGGGVSDAQIQSWIEHFQQQAAGLQPINQGELNAANSWMASENNQQDRSGLFTWPNFNPTIFSFVPGLPGWSGGQDTESQGGGGTSPTSTPPVLLPEASHPIDVFTPTANDIIDPSPAGTDSGTVPLWLVQPPSQEVPSWLTPMPVIGSPQRAYVA